MMLQEGLAGFLEEVRGEGCTFHLENDVCVCVCVCVLKRRKTTGGISCVLILKFRQTSPFPKLPCWVTLPFRSSGAQSGSGSDAGNSLEN